MSIPSAKLGVNKTGNQGVGIMARARNIKPGFFLNHNLAKLNPLTRILFEGLWCISDREGRLPDVPEKIKVLILPYDTCNVDEMLNDLANSPEKFILRYEVDGERYIQIINFSRHQNPHKKESPSIIPPPAITAPDKHGTSTVLVPEKHETSPADSLNLIPDSLNLIPDCEDNAREEPPQPINIYNAFEQEFARPLSPMEIDKIRAWEKDHTPDVINEALKRAVFMAKHNFKYIDTILLEWEKNTIRTVREVQEYEKKFRERVGARGSKKDGPNNKGPSEYNNSLYS